MRLFYKDFIHLKTASDAMYTKQLLMKFPRKASSFKSIILNRNVLKPSQV